MSKSQLMVAEAVGDLHREHGFWNVARALLASALHGRRTINALQDLDARMLRDIGVEPHALKRWDQQAADHWRTATQRSRL